MAKLGAWIAELGFQSEPFVLIEQTAIALFADMERKGELD